MMISPTKEQYAKWMRRVLPSNCDDREHVVYWLYNETCTNPGWDGYIGVTLREKARFLEHKRSSVFSKDIKIKILLRGYAESCYMYEAILRPHAKIGWNIAAGGARGNKSGIPKSEETKKKIGDGNRGNLRPDLSTLNRSLNSKRFKDLTCPYCSKFGNGPTMMRYHFNNCKLKV